MNMLQIHPLTPQMRRRETSRDINNSNRALQIRNHTINDMVQQRDAAAFDRQAPLLRVVPPNLVQFGDACSGGSGCGLVTDVFEKLLQSDALIHKRKFCNGRDGGEGW